jgi:hypothetical protein
MKNRHLFQVILMLLIATSATCNRENTADCHYTLTIQNNSNSDVYYYIWPDTTLDNADNPFPGNISTYKCPSKQSKVDKLRDCWETDYFPKALNGKISTYIFDAHIIETNSWDTVKIYKKYLKRYDYSLQDIQLKNWTVIYP